ncbi:hypothetical protein K466DRAFT_348444 [Polyporus arcularius HHB13444]|uniref:Uncharacterized protein n=1 Tax=Polyporus arcularius HHB13444 TaxID=1314778 RepID=A0A5C3PNC6_9APHY|nr:hypothetical protein K466DRAFT_348444 [Polyporus arcularius HHB13444]
MLTFKANGRCSLNERESVLSPVSASKHPPRRDACHGAYAAFVGPQDRLRHRRSRTSQRNSSTGEYLLIWSQLLLLSSTRSLHAKTACRIGFNNGVGSLRVAFEDALPRTRCGASPPIGAYPWV